MNVRRAAAALLGAAALAMSAPRATGQSPFGPASNVSQNANGSYIPSLVAGVAAPQVFWHDFSGPTNLVHCATHDGAAWPVGTACAANVTQSWTPRAAMDATGIVHVAWRDRTGGNDEIFHASFDGIAWSAPRNISGTAEASGNPAIAVDDRGFPHVAWEEGPAGMKRFFEASFDGASWTPAADTGLPFVQAASLDTLRLAFDGLGTLHGVWHDGATSQTEVFHAERPRGGAWSAPENLSNTPAALSAEPSIACAPDGAVHVAFIEQDAIAGTTFETCLVSRPAFAAWGPKQDISRLGSGCYRPALALRSDGVPQAAWHADTPTGKDVFFVASPGATPVNVSASPGIESSRASLAVDARGDTWLAWAEGATTASEILVATTAPPTATTIRLMVAKDEAAGMVALSWTGGLAPFHVSRGDAPDPSDASWADVTPPGGVAAPAWTEPGLRDGAMRFYLVR